MSHVARVGLLGTVLAIAGALRAARPNPVSPPLYRDVHRLSWGGGRTWPETLFWECTDQTKNAAARGSAAGVEKAGAVPFLSAVRWNSTWKDARPGGKNADKPGWKQWGRWLKDREELLARKADGTIWRYDYGHVSPVMPLDEKDRPPGVPNATYADWQADKIGRCCAAIGTRGIFAADFIEGIPYELTTTIDFNPRILDAFETWAGIDVPGQTVKDRAEFIKARCFVRWNDYWCDGYGRFFGTVARAIKKHTGAEPLLGFQTHFTASRRRMMGTDFRLMLRHVPAKWIYTNIELQSDHLRRVRPFGTTTAIFGCFACREPDFVVAAHMDADHEAFRAAVDHTRKGLSKPARAEWGRKYLKHHWLEVGWTHVADRDGTCRRAAQMFMRHYWDHGKVDPAVLKLMRTVRPVRPFGLACYYSVAIERAFERKGKCWNCTGQLARLRTAGWPVGCFVSDAAIDRLKPVSRPTGWIVFHAELLPPEERVKLTGIAPIVDPAEAPPGPLRFSEGVTGFGFFDQDGRLVITATRTADSRAEATIHLAGLADGAYEATDLLAPAKRRRLAVKGGAVSFALPLDRWDTRVWGLTKR